MTDMIQVKWHDSDEKILYWHISGRSTLSEFENAVMLSYDMVSSKPYIVDVINDLTDVSGLSFNILRMTWLASTNRASNTGVAVVVGPTNIWKELWETMIKIFGHTSHTVRFASTIAQAEGMIREVQHFRVKV